jgi:two-component system sensor kinase FixL
LSTAKKIDADDDQRLDSLRAELVAADRQGTIDRAISALVHEMAQPLASIVNYANACVRLLRSGAASSEKLLEAMQQTAAEALRANEIMRRVREESARGGTHREPLNINDLVREVVAAEQSEIKGQLTTLGLQLADDLPSIEVDRIQIQVVLMNLVRNALEAMSDVPPERRALLIETGLVGNEVHVRVADSGPPVDPAVLIRLFDLYFTTKPRRLGLGLSVCQMLVKAHGGELRANANAAGGLTLQFSVPISVE